MKENILKFQGNQQNPYLKITVNDPNHINAVRTTVQTGAANYKGLWPHREGGILTFDNIAYELRFMIDTKVNASVSVGRSVADLSDRRNVVGRGTCWKV